METAPDVQFPPLPPSEETPWAKEDKYRNAKVVLKAYVACSDVLDDGYRRFCGKPFPPRSTEAVAYPGTSTVALILSKLKMTFGSWFRGYR